MLAFSPMGFNEIKLLPLSPFMMECCYVERVERGGEESEKIYDSIFNMIFFLLKFKGHERCLSWVKIISHRARVFLSADFSFHFLWKRIFFMFVCGAQHFFSTLVCCEMIFRNILTKSNLESSENDFRASHFIIYYNYYAPWKSFLKELIFIWLSSHIFLPSLQGQTFCYII